MVTIGRSWSRVYSYYKRCRFRQLSTETQKAFQGVGTLSESCFSSGTIHSAKIVASAAFSSQWSHSLHSYSTCCSIGSTSSIIKDNCYLNNLAYRRTVAPMNHFYRQFHHGSLRNLQTDAAPSAFGDDRIHDDKHSPERRSSPMEIEELVDYLHEENASDVCVISVPPSLDYVNYFVVCSGFGTRHLRRMADGLIAELKSVRIGRNNRRIRVEGQDCDDWMAVEMGTIVVHFMTEEARSKYELEKLWTLGPHYDDQYRRMENTLENNP